MLTDPANHVNPKFAGWTAADVAEWYNPFLQWVHSGRPLEEWNTVGQPAMEKAVALGYDGGPLFMAIHGIGVPSQFAALAPGGGSPRPRFSLIDVGSVPDEVETGYLPPTAFWQPPTTPPATPPPPPSGKRAIHDSEVYGAIADWQQGVKQTAISLIGAMERGEVLYAQVQLDYLKSHTTGLENTQNVSSNGGQPVAPRVTPGGTEVVVPGVAPKAGPNLAVLGIGAYILYKLLR